MKRTPRFRRNDRQRTTLALLVIVPVGFATKFYSGPAAHWVNNLLGGLFYDLFWCLFFFCLFPSARPRWIVAPVFLATCVLEILQLWHPPVLEAIRHYFLGRTLLGTTFSWLDFPFYVAGCALGWFWIVRTRKA